MRSIRENICCDVMPYEPNEVKLYCIPTQVKLQKVSVFLCYYGLKFSRYTRQFVRRRMDWLSANQVLAFYPYFVWYTIIFQTVFCFVILRVEFSFLIKKAWQKAIEIEIAFFNSLGNPKGCTLENFFYASRICHNFPYKLIPISLS